MIKNFLKKISELNSKIAVVVLKYNSKAIEYLFYLLFFLTPLILTTVNYELFEYNKMLLTYGITIFIASLWFLKMVALKQTKIHFNLFFIPLLFFLLTQIISTVISLDRYTSTWGYYSRFNGGLISIICYILLFFSFINNFPKNKIKNLLIIILLSGFFVSFYGILEHFGIDAEYWVQDVKNRIFSTLGQPNWLAAYLAILIPVSIGFYFRYIPYINPEQNNKNRILSLLFTLCSLLFYIALLFTKSRSGFIAFSIANILFWIIIFYRFKKNILKEMLIINIIFIITTFFIGSPIGELNKLTLNSILKPKSQTQKPQENNNPILNTGITESGDIRKIVWKGALEIAKNNPLIGTGVETFAYSYYKYRPVEHNLTSEWDFLYNKAHNEYLNFLANTGILGFSSYFIFIISFIIYFFISIKKSSVLNFIILNSLFCGWISILISNFFGFSVVVTSLFFFLIPSICFLITAKKDLIYEEKEIIKNNKIFLNKNQNIAIFLIIITALFLEYRLMVSWLADFYFAKGYNAVRQENYLSSYNNLEKAVYFNYEVPVYHDELSFASASLAQIALEQKQATLAAQLTSQAIKESSIAIKMSPNNVNYKKTATKVFFTLANSNENYLKNALVAIKQAGELAPNDPKIIYNLGILLAKKGDANGTIETFKKAIEVKPNYKEARFALAIMYENNKDYKNARKELELILTKIDPQDIEIQKKLKELETK